MSSPADQFGGLILRDHRVLSGIEDILELGDIAGKFLVEGTHILVDGYLAAHQLNIEVPLLAGEHLVHAVRGLHLLRRFRAIRQHGIKVSGTVLRLVCRFEMQLDQLAHRVGYDIGGRQPAGVVHTFHDLPVQVEFHLATKKPVRYPGGRQGGRPNDTSRLVRTGVGAVGGIEDSVGHLMADPGNAIENAAAIPDLEETPEMLIVVLSPLRRPAGTDTGQGEIGRNLGTDLLIPDPPTGPQLGGEVPTLRPVGSAITVEVGGPVGIVTDYEGVFQYRCALDTVIAALQHRHDRRLLPNREICCIGVTLSSAMPC